MKNLGLKIIIAFLSLAIIGLFYVLVWVLNSNDSVKKIDEQVLKMQENKSDEQEKVEVKEIVENDIKAEKIEIILFHSTNRCYSCNKMEELVKKTLEERFKRDLDSGRIVFKEVNWEQPENSQLVSKYKVTGLSVFINEIENWTDNIKEETALWRLLEDEEKFKNYLSDKINKL